MLLSKASVDMCPSPGTVMSVLTGMYGSERFRVQKPLRVGRRCVQTLDVGFYLQAALFWD